MLNSWVICPYSLVWRKCELFGTSSNWIVLRSVRVKNYSPKIPEWPHWGRVTPICVGNLTIIGSDNGLSPGRRQAIIWTNAGILLTRPLGTNFSEILIEIHTFSFNKMHTKCRLRKRRPSCLGLNVLKSRVIIGSYVLPRTSSNQIFVWSLNFCFGKDCRTALFCLYLFSNSIWNRNVWNMYERHTIKGTNYAK